jgi:hypothetical protein
VCKHSTGKNLPRKCQSLLLFYARKGSGRICIPLRSLFAQSTFSRSLFWTQADAIPFSMSIHQILSFNLYCLQLRPSLAIRFSISRTWHTYSPRLHDSFHSRHRLDYSAAPTNRISRLLPHLYHPHTRLANPCILNPPWSIVPRILHHFHISSSYRLKNPRNIATLLKPNAAKTNLTLHRPT